MHLSLIDVKVETSAVGDLFGNKLLLMGGNLLEEPVFILVERKCLNLFLAAKMVMLLYCMIQSE